MTSGSNLSQVTQSKAKYTLMSQIKSIKWNQKQASLENISIKCQAATMQLFFFKSKVNGVTKALIEQRA